MVSEVEIVKSLAVVHGISQKEVRECIKKVCEKYPTVSKQHILLALHSSLPHSSLPTKKRKVPEAREKYLDVSHSTMSITFGECVENHAGMQMIGKTHLPGRGLNYRDLVDILGYFRDAYAYEGEITPLHPYSDRPDTPEAYLLVIRGGLGMLMGDDHIDKRFFEEHSRLVTDKKMYSRGRVVNKHARHNLCFADFNQSPDYEHGKGRVYAFGGSEIPLTTSLREKIGTLNEKLGELYAEGNYYYDVDKCYIGAHGDTERRIVVCARLGASFPIAYQWYVNSLPVGRVFQTLLHSGDIYFMSEKAVGTDWKKKKILTLRHWANPNLK